MRVRELKTSYIARRVAIIAFVIIVLVFILPIFIRSYASYMTRRLGSKTGNYITQWADANGIYVPNYSVVGVYKLLSYHRISAVIIDDLESSSKQESLARYLFDKKNVIDINTDIIFAINGCNTLYRYSPSEGIIVISCDQLHSVMPEVE